MGLPHHLLGFIDQFVETNNGNGNDGDDDD